MEIVKELLSRLERLSGEQSVAPKAQHLSGTLFRRTGEVEGEAEG
jgi:hypothetical protein